MSVSPWFLSGFHPEIINANRARFTSMEVAVGEDDPDETIRFPDDYDVYLPTLGAGGRDAGAWPAVVSTPTIWQFYACKETISGLNPIIVASQAVSYSGLDFSHPSLALYGPDKCRKLPFAAVYDVSIGFLPMIYSNDGMVLFTCFDTSPRYTVASLVGNGLHQEVDCSRLVPDGSREILVEFGLVRSTGAGGSVFAKPATGVPGDGEEVGWAGSGDAPECWMQSTSARRISVKAPSGYTINVRVKGYKDNELS